MMKFDLQTDDRKMLWDHVVAAVEKFYVNTAELPVAPTLETANIRAFITEFAKAEPNNLQEVLNHVIEGMTLHAVHTAHPAYFGLFNPRANFPGILADLLTAVFNPQLAAWSHAPFAVEVEDYLIKFFGKKFGYTEEDIDGVFTTGGAEANLTAIICALTSAFYDYAQKGLQGLDAKPLIYCSTESHHSLIKAARISGLGSVSIKNIYVSEDLKMDVRCLENQIADDKRNGFHPLMVIATAGTTGAGIIDPLDDIAGIAQRHGLWYHVDAAYGGGLVLSSRMDLLADIEKADSITFDAHKWLSVPLGTSLFLTNHKDILSQAFRITTDYMPKDSETMDVIDPFVHSVQWSRRFNGLKLYMALQMLGEDCYRKTIDHQIEMGRMLRERLNNQGWQVYNDTELPVICFGKQVFNILPDMAGQIAQKIVQNQKAWISTYTLKNRVVLRACITNYNTSERDVNLLIEEINAAFIKLQPI